jgi:hypothetical protein
MTKNKNKSLKKIFVELILLTVLTGLLVDLAYGAMEDMFGVCGFTEKVCEDIKLQGAIKGIAALVCAIFAVVIGLFLSKELNGSNNQLDGKTKQLKLEYKSSTEKLRKNSLKDLFVKTR